MDKNYGDILSYRPNVNYSKDELNKTYINKEDDYNTVPYHKEMENIQKRKSTQVVNDIKEYLPSYIYSDIEDVASNISDYMKSIEEKYGTIKINDVSVSNYISKINSNEIKSYKDIEDIMNSKTINSHVEVYMELNSELEYLNMIKEVFLDINYNDNEISLYDSDVVDNLTMSKIQEYEGSESEKINYFNLSVDAKINMVLQGYVESVNMYSQNLYYLLPMNRQNIAPNDEEVIKGLSTTFDDLSKYNKADLSKLNKVKRKNNLSNILKHINNSKVELNILSDAVSKLSSDSNDYSTYVDNVYLNKANEIKVMVTDLFKEVSLLCSYKDDYLDTLIQKEYLRKVFLEF